MKGNLKAEDILKAISEAEKLLGKAEQEIRGIEITGVEKDLAAAIESFKKKVEQVKESSRAKKVEFLKAILVVATLLPRKCIGTYYRGKRRVWYHFDSEGKYLVVESNGVGKHSDTPEGFMKSEEENFFCICNDILAQLQDHLEKTVEGQEDEVGKFEKIKASFQAFLETRSSTVRH